MIARYDLANKPATFDFTTWLTHVRILGATGVCLGTAHPSTRKWPIEEVWRRIGSILWPACELAGLPCHEGDDGEEIGDYKLQGLLSLGVKAIPRLTSVWPAGKARYTVTMRQTSHDPRRNSNDEVWREFARRIGAVVIEDYLVRSILLHERMALYAGAKMNFGVVNGPMGMLYYTPYPMQMWDCENSAKNWGDHGVRVGDQLPWMLSTQKLVWERPSMDALMHEFAKLQ